MGPSRKYIATGGGRYSGVDYVLLFGGTCVVIIWFIDVGHVGVSYEYIGGKSNMIPLEYHRE